MTTTTTIRPATQKQIDYIAILLEREGFVNAQEAADKLWRLQDDTVEAIHADTLTVEDASDFINCLI